MLGLAPGRSDGTVAARASGGTVPYGLLLGPTVVADVGRERALSVPAAAELVGPTTNPSLWVHLLPDRADPAGTFDRVLRHLGVDPASG